MYIPPFNFQTFDWSDIPVETHAGESGVAQWQVLRVGDIRVRKMVYLPGYKADHWCSKGHFMHCLDGEMNTELEDGSVYRLLAGMTYIVGDNCEKHRSFTVDGCTLFVVD